MKNQKKKLPHSVGPALAHGPNTVGLAHGHFVQAGPADSVTCAHAAVTTCGAAADVLCDEVLPTTTKALPGDGWTRWGGRALTETTWHW
jgi:hypothetical protein